MRIGGGTGAAGRWDSLKSRRSTTCNPLPLHESEGALAVTMELEDVIRVFERVGTPVVSDAMGRGTPLPGVKPVLLEMHAVAGPAFTVRVPPGDWLLAVQAIDEAAPGSIIVVDAGGLDESRRAVWGELASNSARVKGVKAVVIHGYARDVEGIRELGYPVFASGISPRAGDPEGKGEWGKPLDIGGVRVNPGDIVVADLNGVMIVPRSNAGAIAKKAEEIEALEARVRRHIVEKGTTLYRALQELGVFGKIR